MKTIFEVIVLLLTMPAVWTLLIWGFASEFFWDRWMWALVHTAFGFIVLGIGGVIQIFCYAQLFYRAWKHSQNTARTRI